MAAGIQGWAFGEHDQGVEEAAAVFGGGGQVAAYRAELAGAGEGVKAAGHFLPQLDHSYVTFRSVVRWRSEVDGESRVVILAVA
jgi:hypothetical protein